MKQGDRDFFTGLLRGIASRSSWPEVRTLVSELERSDASKPRFGPTDVFIDTSPEAEEARRKGPPVHGPRCSPYDCQCGAGDYMSAAYDTTLSPERLVGVSNPLVIVGDEDGTDGATADLEAASLLVDHGVSPHRVAFEASGGSGRAE